LAGSTLAVLVIGSAAWPAPVAAAPEPLPQQWWFEAWGVQSHLWPLSTGEGVTVAVIDTGVEASLPELRDVVLPGTNAEDEGRGDGREDLDSFENPPGHGTGMASLIAAQGRGTGMVGVAPGAKILPIVAQSKPAYAKGIRFAADKGAQVINLSQAVPGRCPEELQESIAYALEKDAVIVAGAGNDGNGANASNSPANCKGVLAVGAVDLKGRPWEKTQRQPYVTVAGPGVKTATVLKDGKLYPGSGTSDASALVSGAVALIRAEHSDMTNREVVRQLIASAADLHDKGKDDLTGYGMIRPYRPLAGTAPSGTANPVFEEFDRWMKENHPEGLNKAAPASEDGGSSNNFAFLPIVIGAGVMLVLSVFAFFFARRKRPGAPAPLGPPQAGPPAGPPSDGRPPVGQPTGAPPRGVRPEFRPPPSAQPEHGPTGDDSAPPSPR